MTKRLHFIWIAIAVLCIVIVGIWIIQNQVVATDGIDNIRQKGEVIPWANSKVTLQEKDVKTGEIILTEYIIGPNGQWSREIIEHPDPSAVGMKDVWDGKTQYSYMPMANMIIKDVTHEEGERFVAHPIFGFVTRDNAKSEGKIIDSNQTHTLYEYGDAVYYINKEKDRIEQIDVYVDGSLSKQITLASIEENVRTTPEDFVMESIPGVTMIEQKGPGEQEVKK